MAVNVTLAVKNFLKATAHADFAGYYNPGMELQINVAQDGGNVVRSEFKGKSFLKYTDNVQEWSNIRIPKHAGTEPEDNDRPLYWNLEEHAEGIGLTGWDWKERVSRYVGFDFDSISNHTRVGLTDEQLVAVREAACAIPWITVRKSTSGKGLHFYVLLATCTDGVWSGGVPTANHHEHAALARAILGKMSAIANFDFQSTVDVCGAVLWVWHRKSKGTDGFTVLKSGSVLTDVPVNWRDHLKVVKGEKRRSTPSFIEEDKQDPFEELTGTHARVPLDLTHKKLIDYLETSGALYWWDADRHLLVCHTADLKFAHEKLALRGIYETVATGKEHGADQNAFAFPITNGGWVVRRHTIGVYEHPVWEQDGSGWTRIYYNVDADITVAARAHAAAEHPKGGWVFKDAEIAQAALQQLGCLPDIAPRYLGRPAVVREHKDGRLIFEVKKEDSDSPMPGWIADGKNWVKIFQPMVKPIKDSDVGSLASDKLIRHLVDSGAQDAGWVVKGSRGDWEFNPLPQVKPALKTWGFSPKEIDIVIGTNVIQSWKLVSKPFEPEYPGDRTWNRNAAQLRFTPNPNSDDLKFPTWQSILQHCGQGLDEAIAKHPWCIANGVLTGADYLMLWVASLFQEPKKPLPYLFFWSTKQDNGKSTFHEALSLLMTTGYVNAGESIVNGGNFNGELQNAILCYIEEKDISKIKTAYNKIKEWVTALNLSIHPKGGTPFLQPNTTHWVQCSNDRDACPILPGDTRITMIQVPVLPFEQMIPKDELLAKLEHEAPDFVRAILDVQLPRSNSRLNIPMISTEEKETLADRNKGVLEKFLEERCWMVNGHALKYSDVYEQFTKYIRGSGEEGEWSMIKFTRALPLNNPSGASTRDNNQKYIGNLTWRHTSEGIEIPKPEARPKYRLVDGKLVS